MQKALDMLQTGTADIVAPVLYQEDMDEGIYCSQNSFATATTVIQVPNSVYDGFTLQGNVKVAVVKGSDLQDPAVKFFKRNEIEAEYVVCQDVDEQIQTVISGKADVMMNSNLEHIPDTSIVAEFLPQSLFFASSNKSILEELDSAIIHIKQANLSFSRDLYEKFTQEDDTSQLTLEETTFIQQSDPLTVAVFDHNAPYQYVDSETGEYKGISIDLLDCISEKTGLQFQFVVVESWDELLPMLEEDKVQLVAQMPYDYDFASERNVTISRSYASAPYVLVADKSFHGAESGKKLALVEVNTYTDGYYVGDVVPYPTMEDCIEAVHSGEADYTYADLYTAQYFLGDPSYNALGFTPQSYSPRSICFGVSKTSSYILLSILNKTINQISASDLQNIITENVNPLRDVTVVDVIIQHPLQAFMLIGIISLLIAVLLIGLLWKKERFSKTLRQRSMEDSLTHLYNAASCRKLVTEKLKALTPGQLGAFLIIDMDHFKEINDRNGHQMGDCVLQQFSELLGNTVREDSVIARIGGDEFVVYLESIRSEENIPVICERIRNRAHSICVNDKPVTISIGAVIARETDSYDALYKLADQALYTAKKNQRDQFHVTSRGS